MIRLCTLLLLSALITLPSMGQATIHVDVEAATICQFDDATGDVLTPCNRIIGDGICSLAEAIDNANADTDTTTGDCEPGSADDTVVLPGGVSYAVNTKTETGLPGIIGSLIIEGNGATLDNDIIFDNVGRPMVSVAGAGHAVVRNLIVDAFGEGIANSGLLHVLDSSINGNACADPAIHVSGGIVNYANGVATIVRSTVLGCETDDGGGGIQNAGQLTVIDSGISGQAGFSDIGASGGGVYNTGSLILIRSTVTGSVRGCDILGLVTRGGGIYNGPEAIVDAVNSDISGTANCQPFSVSEDDSPGGAIFNLGTLRLSHSKVSGSTGGGIGGNLALANPGTVELRNSIVAGNPFDGAWWDCRTNTVTSFGYNLTLEVGGCPSDGPGDVVVTETQWAGGVSTFLVDNGTCTDLDGETVTDDIRGFVRDDGACDIGPFEYGASPDLTTPVIAVEPPSLLTKPNSKYTTISVSDVVTGVTDNRDQSLTVEDVTIDYVSSDEPEDAPRRFDGSTVDDIVIGVDCRSVAVRAERDKKGNGRVYTIALAVEDADGNVGTADHLAHVPLRKKDGVAIDDGPVYSVGCNGTLAVLGKNLVRVHLDEEPIEFRLDPNYPNPFNPSTSIRFDLPETSDVVLSVFDLLGREVARLVDGQMPQGKHEVTWVGDGFPSGVYLYRMETDASRETRQMVLLK